MKTLPKVFIIESLCFEDEQQDRYEGKILCQILSLSGSKPKYIYIRTQKELEEVIDQFEDSNYRYLHFSCHGDKHGIQLTLDNISFEELAKMLGTVIDHRRVFFSSCEVMNADLARALLAKTDCYSVVGPSTKINFDRAAAFWSACYHLLLRDNAKSVKRKKLRNTVARLQKLFRVDIRYYAHSDSKIGFEEIILDRQL